MSIKEYYEQAKQFVVFPRDKSLQYLTAGRIEEIGEVFGKIKRIIRDSDLNVDSPRTWPKEIHDAICLELGDVSWYLVILVGCVNEECITDGRMDHEFDNSYKFYLKKLKIDRPDHFQVLLYVNYLIANIALSQTPFLDDIIPENDDEEDVLGLVVMALAVIQIVCVMYGYDIAKVFDLNIQKLSSRKERNALHGSGDNR